MTMTTIEEVAKKANISIATVSRALRGLPNVAPSTRDRILQIADELDYKIAPHVSRSILGERVIGLVAPLADQWFFSKLFASAELELLSKGYQIVRYRVAGLDHFQELIEKIAKLNLVDGLIISSLLLSPNQIKKLIQLSIPIVTIETRTDAFSSVTIDNISSAQLAIQHLINLGHREIGLIEGLADDPLEFSTPLDRKKGFDLALAQNNIPNRAELRVAGNFSFQGGAEAMKTLFSIPNPPTAVFAISDEMAIGALKTIKDFQLKPAEDISIIGFDNNEIAEYSDLTTIEQPTDEMGETAAKFIDELFQQKQDNQEYKPKHSQLKTRLIIRNTTGKLQTK